MSKAYKITVAASNDSNGVLDIHEALTLVTSFFRILKGDIRDISLDIRSITRENPLIVECLPYNTRTQTIDYESVEQNARSFVRLCDDVLSGKPCSSSVSRLVQNNAKRMLKQAAKGSAKAMCDLKPIQRSVSIEPESTQRAVQILEFPDSVIYPHLYSGKYKGREIGEIDGRIIELGRDRGKPVIKIAERSWEKDIWCSLAASEIQKWKAKLTAADAWNGKRVRVRGELVFKKNGRHLIGVKDGYLSEVEEYDVSVEDLFHPGFTGGLSAKEYLRERWEGTD